MEVLFIYEKPKRKSRSDVQVIILLDEWSHEDWQ